MAVERLPCGRASARLTPSFNMLHYIMLVYLSKTRYYQEAGSWVWPPQTDLLSIITLTALPRRKSTFTPISNQPKVLAPFKFQLKRRASPPGPPPMWIRVARASGSCRLEGSCCLSTDLQDLSDIVAISGGTPSYFVNYHSFGSFLTYRSF